MAKKPQAHPLVTALKKAQYDLTSAKTWLSEVERLVADIGLSEDVGPRHRCQCGVPFRSAQRLAEHVYTSHDGPVPEHWIAGESLAAEPHLDDEEQAA